MKTENEKNGKRLYLPPKVERILLDKEISLSLESAPPVGPDETKKLNAPDHFNPDPYKVNIG